MGWIALGCWTVLWFVVLAPGGGIAWHFFVTGSRLLFSGPYGRYYHGAGGLHLYANYAWLQIGPLALAVAAVLRRLGPDQGLVPAQLVMTGMGLIALQAIRDVARTARPGLAGGSAQRWTFLAGGAIFMIAWVELAVAYGHLDDALALLLAVLALQAAVHGHPALTGIAVGLAADAKPWALIFLPVLLLAGGLPSWRSPVRAARPVRASLGPWAWAAGCAAAVIAAGWLPFFLADPATVNALHYTIVNLPDSALRALGVRSARTPSWDRSAQVGIGCVLGALAIWRGRWPAVILLGVGARIALDPAAHGYYTAGVLAGALIWDLTGARRPLPSWTLLSFCALSIVPLATADPAVRGSVRLALVVAFTLAALLGPSRWYWGPEAERPGPAEPAEPAGPAGPQATTGSPPRHTRSGLSP